jgi:hypothetical protein
MIHEAGTWSGRCDLRIDFVATPYTYGGQCPGNKRWDSDVIDDAGTGSAVPGVSGDGAYRVLSSHSNNKMFISEIDCSTYVEPYRRSEGGSGSETVEGTLKILRRDIGQVFATGHAGWLFDFGHLNPPFQAGKSWYDDPPMIREIRSLLKLGEHQRPKLDISPVSEIAAVYEPKSWLATKSWKAEGQDNWHRDQRFHHAGWSIRKRGRSTGSVQRFCPPLDLTPEDRKRSALFYGQHIFLTPDEYGASEALRGRCDWSVYAPGYRPASSAIPDGGVDRFNSSGWTYLVHDDPLQSRKRCKFFRDFARESAISRFAVVARRGSTSTAPGATARNRVRGKNTMASRRSMRGQDRCRSNYCAGLPDGRGDALEYRTGQRACDKSAAMLVASDKERTFQPHPMAPAEGGPATEHRVSMEFGEVKLFWTKA